MHHYDKSRAPDRPSEYRIYRIGPCKWLRRGVNKAVKAPCGHFKLANVCLRNCDPAEQHFMPFNDGALDYLDVLNSVPVFYGGEYPYPLEKSSGSGCEVNDTEVDNGQSPALKFLVNRGSLLFTK